MSGFQPRNAQANSLTVRRQQWAASKLAKPPAHEGFASAPACHLARSFHYAVGQSLAYRRIEVPRWAMRRLRLCIRIDPPIPKVSRSTQLPNPLVARSFQFNTLPEGLHTSCVATDLP